MWLQPFTSLKLARLWAISVNAQRCTVLVINKGSMMATPCVITGQRL